MKTRYIITLVCAACCAINLWAIDFTPQRKAGALRTKGQYQAAAECYDAIARDTATLPHLRMEAEMLAQECRNLAAGKPLRDPTSSRIALPNLGQLNVAATLEVRPDKPNAIKKALANARKIHEGQPTSYVVIKFKPGTYAMKETIQLEAADSYLILQGNGEVTLDGSVEIRGFKPWKDSILVADVPKGVALERQRHFGDEFSTAPYYPYDDHKYTIDLYEDNMPLTVARWPNEGTVTFDEGFDEQQEVTFHNDRVKRWTNANDMMAMGWWQHLWRDAATHAQVVDAERGIIRLIADENPADGPKVENHVGIHKEPHPFFVFNLLEELDVPGEWYCDRANRKMYVYPRKENAHYTLPTFTKPFLFVKDASHVIVTGLTMLNGGQHAVRFLNTTNCMLLSSRIERFGGYGLIAEESWDLLVQNNRMHTFSFGGIIARANRTDPRPSHIRIINNEVSHFMMRARTYCPALRAEANNVEILHNTFTDGPSSAMRLDGSYLTVAFNRVERVVQESCDQGGIDIFNNPFIVGNRFMFNLWKDFGGGDFAVMQAGIRLDDMISHTLIYGNVFDHVGRGKFGAVQINGGHNNIIDSNIVLHADHFFSGTPWDTHKEMQILQDRMKYATDPENKAKYMRNIVALPEAPKYADEWLYDPTKRDINYYYRNRAFDITGSPFHDWTVKAVMVENVFYGNEEDCFKPIDNLYVPTIPMEEYGTYEQ